LYAICLSLNSRPRRREQDDNGDLARRQVLLIAQVAIRGDQKLVTLLFGNLQQVAIGQC